MGRYSFTVRDFHSLLLTGLRRRTVRSKYSADTRILAQCERNWHAIAPDASSIVNTQSGTCHAQFRRSGRFDLPQFGMRLARGGWTNLSEFRSTLSRSGVGSKTRPLREAMLSETTQVASSFGRPIIVRKLYSWRIRLPESSPTFSRPAS